ncbi:hypothetical protein V474_18150 [Novosphingobium barchaimii LL02]|uniref:Uncharacterized protein n=1 Tax=Novosphingobium barchaimii LL02 TaxID=1114963 RepID=A0A0J7XV27_9SPHN|nr:hypothetical protein [Novosphingobium barchaimii]KMS55472.1 hypothetical protein V474_18150 [Novosphingobium barchaimii LL02]
MRVSLRWFVIGHAPELQADPARVTWFHYILVATFVFKHPRNDIFVAIALVTALENMLCKVQAG